MQAEQRRFPIAWVLIALAVLAVLLILGLCAMMGIFSTGTVGPGPPVNPEVLGVTPTP